MHDRIRNFLKCKWFLWVSGEISAISLGPMIPPMSHWIIYPFVGPGSIRNSIYHSIIIFVLCSLYSFLLSSLMLSISLPYIHVDGYRSLSWGKSSVALSSSPRVFLFHSHNVFVFSVDYSRILSSLFRLIHVERLPSLSFLGFSACQS